MTRCNVENWYKLLKKTTRLVKDQYATSKRLVMKKRDTERVNK